MNSLEELRSKIELMKQALLFYGNKENYLFFKNKDAPVALDEGTQARFALKQLEDLDEMNEEMGQEYMEFFKKEAKTPENIMKLINEIKNVDDIDNLNL